MLINLHALLSEWAGAVHGRSLRNRLLWPLMLLVVKADYHVQAGEEYEHAGM
jgi:hypothetical protein